MNKNYATRKTNRPQKNSWIYKFDHKVTVHHITTNTSTNCTGWFTIMHGSSCDICIEKHGRQNQPATSKDPWSKENFCRLPDHDGNVKDNPTIVLQLEPRPHEMPATNAVGSVIP
jgi:hypothetical protein